jgi:hypothetical protein
MISIANQRRESLKKTFKDNLKFSVSDLRNFRGENPRNIILSLFHVASYQVDDSDLVKFFTSASENLRPGGLFIFDYWFLPAVIKLQPENRVKNGENDTYLGQRTTNSKWISQDVVSVTFDITIKNKVSHEEINLQEVHNMRGLDLDTIIRLMPKNLNHIETFNWLTYKKPTDQDWNAVSVFKKIV